MGFNSIISQFLEWNFFFGWLSSHFFLSCLSFCSSVAFSTHCDSIIVFNLRILLINPIHIRALSLNSPTLRSLVFPRSSENVQNIFYSNSRSHACGALLRCIKLLRLHLYARVMLVQSFFFRTFIVLSQCLSSYLTLRNYSKCECVCAHVYVGSVC